MTLLPRPAHIPSSLLHLTFNTLQHRQLSLSCARASYGFSDSSSSSSSSSRGSRQDRPSAARTSGGRGGGPSAYAPRSKPRQPAGFGLKDDFDSPGMDEPPRGEGSARGGRGGGTLGREGRFGSSGQRWGRESREDAHTLPGDDTFGLGEDRPWTKDRPPHSRNEPPSSSGSYRSRPQYDAAEIYDEESVPYAQSRDDLRGPTSAKGPSMRTSNKYSNDDLPTFDEDDAKRAKNAAKRASPLERFKLERPSERETLREQMFREVTSREATAGASEPSSSKGFFAPRDPRIEVHAPQPGHRPTRHSFDTEFNPEAEDTWLPPVIEPEVPGRDPLLNLGIRPIIASRMKTQFPEFVEPTAFQTALVHGVMSGRDVLAKESTGEGKTFALLLALLSVERIDRKKTTVLFLVPSGTLALQILAWATRLIPTQSSVPSTIATLLRPSLPHSPTLEERRDDLLKTPPHILITTPTALAALSVDGIHSLTQSVRVIAVDEADALIWVSKAHDSPRTVEKHLERPKRTAKLLQTIFARKSSMRPTGGAFVRKPQVIMISATMNSRFRHVVVYKEKWVHPEKGTVHIPFADFNGGMPPKMLLSGLSDGRGGEGRFDGKVDHHVVVVDPLGEMRNLESEPPEELERALPVNYLPNGTEDPTVKQNVIDAIAELYALEEERAQLEEEEEGLGGWSNSRVRATLVVVPNGAPVQSLCKALREYALDARTVEMEEETQRAEVLDRSGGPKLPRDKKKKNHANKSDPSSAPAAAAESDSPTSDATTPPQTALKSPIYVYTASQLRGIDIPHLTTCIILSPSIDSHSTYIHLSGRVGRMSRPGKVITLISGDSLPTADDLAHSEAVERSRAELHARKELLERLRKVRQGEVEARDEGERVLSEGMGKGVSLGKVEVVRERRSEVERVVRVLEKGGMESVEVEGLEYVR